MKRMILFIAFAFFYSISSFAQNSENFIELKNGTIIQANDQTLTESESFKEGIYLKLGEEKYLLTAVKGYQYKGQYFYNFKNSMFIQRTITGKINVFEYLEHYTTKGQSKTRLHRYLQKGDNTSIVSFTSAKLRAMLQGNKEAMTEYRIYEKRRKKARFYTVISIPAFAVGISTVAASQIFIAEEPSKTGLTVVGAVVGTAGLAGIFVGINVKNFGEKYLFNAIEIYNKG